MDVFQSPMRMIPPLTPRRVPSPAMSPAGRRGRTYGSSEESRLRDLSPETTLRAFTQKPMPFDTTRDEYKIFSCIETLTAAERDLGSRVAKAAQRLKIWCAEIEQWGWSGSFEKPSAQVREQRRRSIELRIREHVADSDMANVMPPLEYWGSMLSVEVEQHEARLDDIADEMLKLDVEELKEHVLDMHPAGRSRPSSAGYEANRQHYKVMDDFSFLITQTLLSALPHHAQLKARLSTWTARVSILREAPRYTGELDTAQEAMRLGWDAIEAPSDTSDAAFEQWKKAVDTISLVLHQKVSDLGRQLDKMLDTLEGQEDSLPEHWIDIFETTEADYGRWKHESRRRVIDLEVRRRAEAVQSATTSRLDALNARIDSVASTLHSPPPKLASQNSRHNAMQDDYFSAPQRGIFSGDYAMNASISGETDVTEHELAQGFASPSKSPTALHPVATTHSEKMSFEPGPASVDEDSDFEEGDTVVQYELDEGPEEVAVLPEADVDQSSKASLQGRPKPLALFGNPTITKNDGQDSPVMEPPQTPRSWRGSLDSLSTDISPDSSPPSTVEESPSVRNATNRSMRAPRPELNAAMAKRRPAKTTTTADDTSSAPWPPTHFAQKANNSAEELERKISDILTTIPAHIRLRSGPGPDAPEVKSARGLLAKSSRGYLRAARSVSGLKSPELTLSPAKRRRSAAAARGDNDIKLYHLTQPGKEQPIKLFIRRVGENGERVMVRVGGGWSDLGEYLRQYAEHHGRRTASEGKFEVLGLEVKNPDSSPTRPDSRASKMERRISVGFPLASPSTTPVKSSGLAFTSDEAPPPMPSFIPGTPGATTEDPTIPSTTSSRSSWQGREVGMAGPSAKKLDLSGEKLEWIEGMMKQARTVSSNVITSSHPTFERTDSRSDSRPGSAVGGGKKTEFGDLGKVGATKRVFMKGGKPGSGDH
ncbi:hypothetical protein BKA58DRAFT_411504 [Alternaria rosae]|uniref:uncharacterized protein n=1 Tax=Alternaria rosae TaxID=1187941 RepID=UPI001E8EBBC7|nr:uncharacterized protein BKA58DRAFT_411504 [Alternaria rosae]KAH6870326.1 hypothetical protein BKA58DRAFT_411504 [Alternaria rosae]